MAWNPNRRLGMSPFYDEEEEDPNFADLDVQDRVAAAQGQPIPEDPPPPPMPAGRLGMAAARPPANLPPTVTNLQVPGQTPDPQATTTNLQVPGQGPIPPGPSSLGAASVGAGVPMPPAYQLPPVPQPGAYTFSGDRPIEKPSIGRRIAGALLGYASGEGIPGMVQGAMRPGYQQALGRAGMQAGMTERQAKLEQEAAQTAKMQGEARADIPGATAEHLKAQSVLNRQQAATLEAEGKRAPRGNYIVFGKDGIFDAATGEIVRQPSDAKESDFLEIDPEKGKALGLKPSPTGQYLLPKEGIAAYISGQMKPDKPEKLDQIGAAIKASGGDPFDPRTVTPQIASKALGLLKQQQPGINLTPEAIQFWAQGAASGLPLPSMGYGPSGAKAREQILNTAPSVAGGNPLAANRAEQRADAGSMASMTEMLDSVTAFEGTAKANLDAFLAAAKPIVDSGSPWVNQPLRAVAQRGLGSGDLAAYNAARQVALTEIAKVVNNPNLSSVLSDSARREVMDLIPKDATLGQIYRVANVLTQDMANRKKFLQQGLQGIKGRMGAGQAAPQPEQASGGAQQVREQKNARTGEFRHSLDGGKTWLPGRAPSR